MTYPDLAKIEAVCQGIERAAAKIKASGDELKIGTVHMFNPNTGCYCALGHALKELGVTDDQMVADNWETLFHHELGVKTLDHINTVNKATTVVYQDNDISGGDKGVVVDALRYMAKKFRKQLV